MTVPVYALLYAEFEAAKARVAELESKLLELTRELEALRRAHDDQTWADTASHR